MFTVFLNNHAGIIADLMSLYFPKQAKIIDVTYGTGALWWKILEDEEMAKKYQVTACDAVPNQNPKIKEKINQRSLLTDNYDDLGVHDALVFDPPYLIGRTCFNYSHTEKLEGPRSWSSDKLPKYVANPTIEAFDERVRGLLRIAPTVLKPNGILIVKVMDPRHNGQLIDHHIRIVNILREKFDLIDHGIYIRQGATNFKIKGHLQNLHGHYLIFRLRLTNSSNSSVSQEI